MKTLGTPCRFDSKQDYSTAHTLIRHKTVGSCLLQETSLFWITSWPGSRILHWSKSSFYWQRQLQFPNAQLSRDQFSFVPMEIKSNRMAGGTRWSTCVLVCFSWLLDYPWFISNWEDSNCTAKSPWDQSIILILQPSFDMAFLVFFMVSLVFSQFMFVVIIKLFCTDMKIKAKTFSDHVAQILGNPGKSSEIN